ncbi:MAG: DUF2256 and DUF3253 domain-containing protein [Myxococcaceae bacterium]|nr:DUF2256 and DUF3253 domain-containing protein [Myxococcaceae bacterium]
MDTKTCVVCGRTIEWRKRWERSWAGVKYCSDGCRRRRREAVDDRLERAILVMLEARPRDATVCPSEVARMVAPDDWRPLMQPVREAARRLVAKGLLDLTQHGREVDGSTARGPVRLRRR